MLFLMLMDNANPDFKGTPLFNIDTAVVAFVPEPPHRK